MKRIFLFFILICVFISVIPVSASIETDSFAKADELQKSAISGKKVYMNFANCSGQEGGPWTTANKLNGIDENYFADNNNPQYELYTKKCPYEPWDKWVHIMNGNAVTAYNICVDYDVARFGFHIYITENSNNLSLVIFTDSLHTEGFSIKFLPVGETFSISSLNSGSTVIDGLKTEEAHYIELEFISHGLEQKGTYNIYVDGELANKNPIEGASFYKMFMGAAFRSTESNTDIYLDNMVCYTDEEPIDKFLPAAAYEKLYGTPKDDTSDDNDEVQSGDGKEATEDVTNTAAEGFKDIEGHWAEAAVEKLRTEGIVSGFNGIFRPEDDITYAEFLAMLLRCTGENPITGEAWETEVCKKASENGYIPAYITEKRLLPGDVILREDMAAITLACYLKEKNMLMPISESICFADASGLTINERKYIAAAYDLNLIHGLSTEHFGVGCTTTRAQSAVIIGRLSEKLFGEAD